MLLYSKANWHMKYTFSDNELRLWLSNRTRNPKTNYRIDPKAPNGLYVKLKKLCKQRGIIKGGADPQPQVKPQNTQAKTNVQKVQQQANVQRQQQPQNSSQIKVVKLDNTNNALKSQVQQQAYRNANVNAPFQTSNSQSVQQSLRNSLQSLQQANTRANAQVNSALQKANVTAQKLQNFTSQSVPFAAPVLPQSEKSTNTKGTKVDRRKKKSSRHSKDKKLDITKISTMLYNIMVNKKFLDSVEFHIMPPKRNGSNVDTLSVYGNELSMSLFKNPYSYIIVRLAAAPTNVVAPDTLQMMIKQYQPKNDTAIELWSNSVKMTESAYAINGAILELLKTVQSIKKWFGHNHICIVQTMMNRHSSVKALRGNYVSMQKSLNTFFRKKN